MLKIAISLFLLGLYFGIGPCLASCGPLVVSYVAGTEKNPFKGIAVYLLFSLSRIFVYLVLALLIFYLQLTAKSIFEHSARYLYLLGGIFIIFIGILMAVGKNLNYKFCRKFETRFLKKDALTIILFGFTIGILPCAPLLSVFSYIGLVAKSWLVSLFLSLSFGLGTLFSPLFVLAGLAGFIPLALKNNRRVLGIFHSICGLIIAFLGVGVLFRRVF
jgi:sulfite exporter TauE/SafE